MKFDQFWKSAKNYSNAFSTTFRFASNALYAFLYMNGNEAGMSPNIIQVLALIVPVLLLSKHCPCSVLLSYNNDEYFSFTSKGTIVQLLELEDKASIFVDKQSPPSFCCPWLWCTVTICATALRGDLCSEWACLLGLPAGPACYMLAICSCHPVLGAGKP
jgi:hypothetical protein